MENRERRLSTTYLALIRGINVGKAKRVGMAELREVVEDLGYRDVKTLLNSGNVVFTSPRGNAETIAGQIEKGMAGTLGVSARVTVLTAKELAAIVAENSLKKVATDHSRLLVGVLNDPADRSKLAPLAKQDWGKEVLAIGSRAVYLWCPDGVLGGRLFETVNKALGDGVTTRNWATVLKLHALAEEQP
jgi:uncharacterized protein (DUF1697 family)